ncbi:3',5'-cyclic AMP phosphodiesterase CpdA [Tranquillimonas rosea]|uniref:3',5'-cyclic AMP phosphodiesterase CpdA n=1 Tax=Tranquillimonas rosea TaxID=641238 RepID=A0A1H9U6X9_9RHOB|nr:metallophosphoesterase family protein [Tranquillimonas rosea]SES05236.1 3',5'-cyclic AMP phosphodiesterase CpdA [Tranquillimonas rosea]
MRRVVHLSDLHFDRIRPELVGPLIDTVSGMMPHLVVVSGDLTQRARDRQFAQARNFLDRLEVPAVLTVPGNHDVPLDEPLQRFTAPFRRYRRHIDRALEPRFEDAELCVQGMNTVNPLSWQTGRLGNRALKRLERGFGDAGDRMRLVVLHHPLSHPPGVDKREMSGAKDAAGSLGDHGADIVLCGHLHTWRADRYRVAGERGRGTLLVQAGTVLSDRVRGEGNDFNLLTVDGPRVTIDRYVAGGRAAYDLQRSVTYRREATEWQRLE